MVSYSNSIIFFSLILVLLILCDKVQGSNSDLGLQIMPMVSNFYLIVSFSLFGFGQLLSLCDIEGFTLVVHDVVNQAPINDQNKVMENPVSRVENVIGVRNTGNDKDKVLENSIDNEQAPINIAAAQKASFVDEATKIFIE